MKYLLNTASMATLVLAISPAAFANDAAVIRCRAVADAAQRLACYDAIEVFGGAKAPVAEAPRFAVVPIPKVALVEPVQPAKVEKPAAALFGMEQQMPQNQVERIESSIEGRFEGWSAKSSIQLANGQTWQISDGTSAIYDLTNPKVTVRRGIFGSFYMEIEGVGRLPRVRRLR